MGLRVARKRQRLGNDLHNLHRGFGRGALVSAPDGVYLAIQVSGAELIPPDDQILTGPPAAGS